MYIQTTYINNNLNCMIGEDIFFIPNEEMKGFFKRLLKQYGKCISKMYIDYKNKSNHIGYIFQKRAEYEDCNKTYIRETWITFYAAKLITGKYILKYLDKP